MGSRGAVNGLSSLSASIMVVVSRHGGDLQGGWLVIIWGQGSPSTGANKGVLTLSADDWMNTGEDGY